MQNKRLEMKKTKGSIMLLFAAFFWGTTFVAQTQHLIRLEHLHLTEAAP